MEDLPISMKEAFDYDYRISAMKRDHTEIFWESPFLFVFLHSLNRHPIPEFSSDFAYDRNSRVSASSQPIATHLPL